VKRLPQPSCSQAYALLLDDHRPSAAAAALTSSAAALPLSSPFASFASFADVRRHPRPCPVCTPMAGKKPVSLVGVRPDQLLNHYSQQRGFHIGVLSDDLLTIVLYAAGGLVDSTVMGNASSDGFPHTAFTRDSIKRVLACRLVNSKWRALSARPVVASAVLGASKSYLSNMIHYAKFLRDKVSRGVVLANPDTAFLVRLYENGLNGGLLAAPANTTAMQAVVAYHNHLFRNGCKTPGLVVCLPSQVSMWSLAFQCESADGAAHRYCKPVIYTGSLERRAGLIRESAAGGTVFIATFSIVMQELELDTDDDDDDEQGSDPMIILNVRTLLVDERRDDGLLLGRTLLRRLRASKAGQHEVSGATHVELRPAPLPSEFSEILNLSGWPCSNGGTWHESPDDTLTSMLEVADRFSFGDETSARWGIETFATTLLGKVVGCHYQVAQP